MSEQENYESSRWDEYYRVHEQRPATPLFEQALAAAGTACCTGRAVDLGCGAGNETRALLKAGWYVHAMDKEPSAIDRVRAIGADYPVGQLEATQMQFEELKLLPSVHLIYAGLSLPFCRPDSFGRLWEMVVSALEPGGVFAGHLFGDRDDWSANPKMTFHRAAEVESLGAGLDVVFFREIEEDGKSLQGPKHWHRYEAIFQKLKAED